MSRDHIRSPSSVTQTGPGRRVFNISSESESELSEEAGLRACTAPAHIEGFRRVEALLSQGFFAFYMAGERLAGLGIFPADSFADGG